MNNQTFNQMSEAFKQIISETGIETIKLGTKGYYYAVLTDEDDLDTTLGCVNDIYDVRRIEKEMAKLGYEITNVDIEMF